jgi:predicted nucleic acid-binding protein
LLRARAELVEPVILEPIVLGDPNDDPVLYTALAGQADVLCTLDNAFYAPEVIEICRKQGISVMNDVELLRRIG